MRLEFGPGIIGGVARTTCLASEYSLDCSIEVNQRLVDHTLSAQIDRQLRIPTAFLLIADTTTIEFSGIPRLLRRIDAYTNLDRWRTAESIDLPRPEAEGSLQLVTSFPSEDDRMSIQGSPEYEWPADGAWIGLRLREDPDAAYYTVATDLIVGLSGDEIVAFYMLHPSIERIRRE